ncbi:DUF5672 family protein [Novosphingobium piscinae]|uniref:DUF5672 domain-containing protein n=1 Tax=Novosphingobium piscinae TaxID=1507448 RepID=A0A7X1FY63_9SPHN|nr:DUF5672 family protein [Novosphingobium piscinae]MBC2669054.1 hypothetical protein [Novosphingobium piscinae]
MNGLLLPDVTLCSASSVNVAATISAMQHCLDRMAFADAVLFTDVAPVALDHRIRWVRIERLHSAADYSRFMLGEVGQHVASSHCLIVQWDGFVIDPQAWDPRFLEFDYIGAVWPQFEEHRVGNGGFSLRSRKLLQVLADPAFADSHPEDLAICRSARPWLEQRHGIRFADPETAARFSYERERAKGATFGFHGAFNLPTAVGADAFWTIYRTLDHRGPVFHDARALVGRLFKGPYGTVRVLRFLLDGLRDWLAARLGP